MSSRTIVEMLDDLDPTQPATGTVSFGIDGQHYEIDLSEANQERLRTALAEWVSAARRMPRNPEGGRRKASRSDPSKVYPANPQNALIREWAHEQGIQLGVRGRIPDTVREQYWASKSAFNPGPGDPPATTDEPSTEEPTILSEKRSRKKKDTKDTAEVAEPVFSS